MLAVFAAFEQVILRGRTRASLAHTGRIVDGWVGQQLRPPTLRKSGHLFAPASANPKSLGECESDEPLCAAF